MSMRLHQLIEAWRLQEALERAKHPEHKIDIHFKDERGNLPIHKLVCHANAIDTKLNEKKTRPDRPHFFGLLILILDRLLDLINDHLINDQTSINIRNNDGKLPSELLGGRVSGSPGVEDETLKRLFEIEELALELEASHTAKTGEGHSKPAAGVDTHQNDDTEPTPLGVANKPRNEPNADVKPPPKAPDKRVITQLINCNCGDLQLDPDCDWPCKHIANFFHFSAKKNKDIEEKMNERLPKAMIYTRKHKTFVAELNDPTKKAIEDYVSRRKWEDFSQKVLTVCRCNLGPDEGCRTCNAEHLIFKNLPSRISPNKKEECLVQLNKALKGVEDFESIPSVHEVRHRLTDHDIEFKQQATKLEEDLKQALMRAGEADEASKHQVTTLENDLKSSKEELKRADENDKVLQEALKQGEKIMAGAKKTILDLKCQLAADRRQKTELKQKLDKTIENAKKESEELKAEKTHAIKEAEAKYKTKVNKIQNELDIAKEDLDFCRKEKEENRTKYEVEYKFYRRQYDLVDDIIDKVTSMYYGPGDNNSHRLKPSELSEVLRDGLPNHDLCARAQYTLLEKILGHVMKDTISDEKRKSLLRDVPKVVENLCQTTDEEYLVNGTNYLLLYLGSINFTDSQGNMKRAQTILESIESSSATPSSSLSSKRSRSSDLIKLEKQCRQLAQDCVEGELQGTSIEVPIKLERGNSDSNRMAVSTRPSIASNRAKRGRDESLSNTSTTINTGASNKKQHK